MEITASFLAVEIAALKAREEATRADLIAIRAALQILEQLRDRAEAKPEDGDTIEESTNGNNDP